PPAAMLVGVVLDDMLGTRSAPKPRQYLVYLGGFAVAAVLATIGASKLWPGSMFGAKPAADAKGSWPVALVMIGIAAAIFYAVVVWFQKKDEGAANATSEPPESDDDKSRNVHEQLMLGAATVAGAFATVLVGRDLAAKAEGSEMSGGVRLL